MEESMPDVVFISSVFNEMKIAEPMGASILTSCLREKGFSVEMVEPSFHGWTVQQTVLAVADLSPRIVAISMLRDKNLEDVLEFACGIRRELPDSFIVVGGHGPSIAIPSISSPGETIEKAMAGLEPELQRALAIRFKIPYLKESCEEDPYQESATDLQREFIPRQSGNNGLGVAELMVASGRGKGATHTECSTRRSSGEWNVETGPYYDKSLGYVKLLLVTDTFMLGESDKSFPVLVGKVLSKVDWRMENGLAYIGEELKLTRTEMPSKIHDLDAVPFMARDLLSSYTAKYGKIVPASILSSRGCRYRCTFCSVVKYEKLQAGPPHRQRSNENLISEICSLHYGHGIDHFNFEDDNFIINSKQGREKLLDLCGGISRLPFKITFTFFCRADSVSKELFTELKNVGLTGIYFGIESVHPGDLEFFHKGLKIETIFKALDTLLAIGFSASVDARLRIMLGYITWHPLTTIQSLRDSLAFLRKYEAPPKILRRKLRPYTGTEIIGQIISLGLLNSDNIDGWDFREAGFNSLYEQTNKYIQKCQYLRDKLRTVEKTVRSKGLSLEEVPEITGHRKGIDRGILDFFEGVLDEASKPGFLLNGAIREYTDAKVREFNDKMAALGVLDLVQRGYKTYGIEDKVHDLYRK
jgi:radical SAM superfamily enzyme YgiQ (UPF0313 family)